MRMAVPFLMLAGGFIYILLHVAQLDIRALLNRSPKTISVNSKEDVTTVKFKKDIHYILCNIPGGSGTIMQRVLEAPKLSPYWQEIIMKTFKDMDDVYLGDHSAAMLIVSDSMEYYIFLDMYKDILPTPSREVTVCERQDGEFTPRLNDQ